MVYDLYDDVMEEVVDRTSGQVQGIMGTMMRTFGELNQISDTVDRISKNKDPHQIFSFLFFIHHLLQISALKDGLISQV